MYHLRHVCFAIKYEISFAFALLMKSINTLAHKILIKMIKYINARRQCSTRKTSGRRNLVEKDLPRWRVRCYCEDRFHIHVFNRSSNIWLPYIHNRLFTTSRVYLEPTQWPAPSWLVSSVGRALHRYRRGHGFKSRSGLNFFKAFFSLLLK